MDVVARGKNLGTSPRKIAVSFVISSQNIHRIHPPTGRTEGLRTNGIYKREYAEKGMVTFASVQRLKVRRNVAYLGKFKRILSFFESLAR